MRQIRRRIPVQKSVSIRGKSFQQFNNLVVVINQIEKLKETMELTKKQTEQILSNFLDKENGLNEVLGMMLNGMMLCERQDFLKTDKSNKGNGYRLGKVFGHGTQVELRIPRDRMSRFTPTILALFREQESYLREVSFQLYSKGLTTRDISDVMGTIYGKHYSKSTISNFSQTFYEQMEAWRERKLEEHYLALYIDGLQVKVRRKGEYQNECYYIIMGLKPDYRREIIAIETMPTESSTGWQMVLESIKDRGVKTVGLVVSDNLSGLDQAVAKVFAKTPHQLCVVHLQRNLRALVREEDKKELSEDIRWILSPDDTNNSKDQARSRIKEITHKWRSYKKLVTKLKQTNWEMYLTYLRYDTRIRRMIYTTNWIERFNKSARRTLKIRGAMPSEESAIALITSVGIDKGKKKYNYPIYNFKFEPKLAKRS